MKEKKVYLPKNDIHKRYVDTIELLLVNDSILNKTIIAEKLLIGRSNLSEILNFRMGVSVELCNLLVENFSINSHWLLTGQGEMFLPVQNLNGQNGSQTVNETDTYKLLMELNECRKEIIELQKQLLSTQGNEKSDMKPRATIEDAKSASA